MGLGRIERANYLERVERIHSGDGYWVRVAEWAASSVGTGATGALPPQYFYQTPQGFYRTRIFPTGAFGTWELVHRARCDAYD